MTFGALLTLLVILAILITLTFEWFPPELIMAAGVVSLLLGGVVSPKQAFSGFSNPAIIALAALYVLMAALRQTGFLSELSDRLLKGCKTERGARRRLLMTIAPLSAFLNNTPLVAMAMPIASGWARRMRVSTRPLFMPLSFAAILGGTCTVLGTSSHLVTHGLLLERDLPGLSVFELLPIGLCILIVGLPLISLMSERYLAEGADAVKKATKGGKEYTTDLCLAEGSPLEGRTVEQAGLRHLDGLFLVRINRNGRTISPIGPSEILIAGDRLTFAGLLDTIVELSGRRGLYPPGTQDENGWSLHEAVISRSSPLIGRSIRDANFRGRYGAAVIAVHRHGGRIKRKIGDIVLRHGDTVLVQSAQGFARTFRDSSDFYLISDVPNSGSAAPGKAWLAAGVFFCVVLSAASGLLPLVTAAATGALACVGFGCVSLGLARRSVDTSVIVVMACAIGIAQGAEVSGLAEQAIHILSGSDGSMTPFVMLCLIYCLGMILTELLTNVAAVAFIFPVAVGVAQAMGVDARPFIIATTVSTALSLATPIGYQTNMMVYGSGDYRFIDFVKVGLPIQCICGLVAVSAIACLYGIQFTI